MADKADSQKDTPPEETGAPTPTDIANGLTSLEAEKRAAEEERAKAENAS